MKCINHPKLNPGECLSVVLRDKGLEVADVIMDQKIRVDARHMHHSLEETNLILVALVLYVLHRPQDAPRIGINGKVPPRRPLR